MKNITAYIKPDRLLSVVIALHQLDDLTGLSVSEVRGFGRGRAKDSPDRFTDEVGAIKHAKIEIFCHDDLAPEIASLIERIAHTGLRGDGKIYISPVDDAIRISTGETGEQAI